MKKRGTESLDRIVHIRNAIQKIEVYTRDMDPESFFEDEVVVDAVLFQFSVIGEAVNHIEKGLLSRYDYPWYKVRAFRNLITHEYFHVKHEAVWEIITSDLPELTAIVERILSEES